MSCVRKRRGKWVIDYYYQFGKRHWETVGTNKKAAELKLAERLQEIDSKTFAPVSQSKTFNEVSEKWFQEQILPNRRPKTSHYYRNILSRHLQPYFGTVKMVDIDFRLIERYMAEKMKGEGFNKTSINKTVTSLGTIMRYAVRHGHIKANPVPNVVKLRIGPEELKEEKRFLTPDEIQVLLANTDSKHGPIIELAVFTGLREGEILGLQWMDINWDKGQVYVERTLQLGKFYSPKTKTSRRRVDVDPEILMALKRWKLRCPKGEHDLVFPSSTGTPMDAVNMLKNVFYPDLRRSKLPKIRFHDLRHTNASLRIEAGQNMKYIQEQLGHSSIQVTLDVYGHLLRSSDQEAAIHLRKTVFNDGQKHYGSKMVAVS